MEFNERTPLEQGFAPIFQAEVRPALMSLEGERLALLAKAKRYGTIVLGIALVIAGAIVLKFGATIGPIIGAVFVGIIGLVGMGIARSMQASKWSGSVVGAVMPAVCAHVGELRYDSSASGGFPLDRMRSLGIIGGYDNSTLSDRMEGRHRDTEFELVEAKLTKKSQDSDGDTQTSTVFDGLLFNIGVPVAVPTPILITRDYGKVANKLGSMFSGKKGRGMPRVEVPHEAFEAVFEVHAENPEAARSFLPPAFLDNLLAIGEQEGGNKGTKAMVAGFADQSFYLALSRSGDFMAMGSLSTPVADMEDDLHAVFADIEMVHRVIDRLHGV